MILGPVQVPLNRPHWTPDLVLCDRGEIRKRAEENLYRPGGRRLILGNSGGPWNQPEPPPLLPDVAVGGKLGMENAPPLSRRYRH